MSGCFIFSLASVLAPMMILFGLKFGIVSSMVYSLVENPVNREIRPVGSGHYEQQWFDDIRARDDVEFIIPKTRALAATIQLKSETASRILSTELLATAPNDPMLAGQVSTPGNYLELILSHNAAQKLNVIKGQTIDASLARQFRGKRDRVHLPITVIDIADASVTSRNIAWVHLDLLVATEQFKDGRAVPDLGWEGDKEKLESRN